jgi:hypothetical protein
LCIVSTNVGGVPYLLDDGNDALLVPPNDAGAMAQAVRRILARSDLAQHLSVQARRNAEQFNWTAVTPQWDRLLRSVAEVGSAPPQPGTMRVLSPKPIDPREVVAKVESTSSRQLA